MKTHLSDSSGFFLIEQVLCAIISVIEFVNL